MSKIEKMNRANFDGYDEVIFVVERITTGVLQVVGVSGEFVFYRSHSFNALGNDQRKAALETVVVAAEDYSARNSEVGHGTALNDALSAAGFRPLCD